jgi:hypothetical protein
MGNTAAYVISDGDVPYPTDFLFPNVPGDELDAQLSRRLDETGQLWVPYHCLLVTTPSQTMLIDSGLGSAAAAACQVPGLMEAWNSR